MTVHSAFGYANFCLNATHAEIRRSACECHGQCKCQYEVMHAHSVVNQSQIASSLYGYNMEYYSSLFDTTTAFIFREIATTDKGPNRSRDMSLYRHVQIDVHYMYRNRKCNSFYEFHFDQSAIS